jgi:hypothetical protein
MHVNWLAVVAAALSSFPLGFLWYGPLFGKIWQREVGLSADQLKAGNMGVIFGGSLALALIQSAAFAIFLSAEPMPEIVLYGLAGGLCFVASAIAVQNLFERKSWKLTAINGGYNVIAFTLIGAIIGAWR